MLKILTLQAVAASLGTASIGAADWLYDRGRIGQRVHDLWVSASSAAVCLPLLTWTINVFLGFGVFSQVLVGTLEAIMFLWIYQNLRKVPGAHKLAWGLLASRSSGGPIPSSPNLNSFGTDPIHNIDHLRRQIPPQSENRRVEDLLPR